MNFTGSIFPSPCGDWYPDPLWTVCPALKNSEATPRMLCLGKRSVCLDTTLCSVFIRINNGLFITQKGGLGGPLEDMEICGDKGGNSKVNADFAMIWVSKRSSPCLQKITDQDCSVCDKHMGSWLLCLIHSFIYLLSVCLSIYLFIT